jgi:hypothetical protein
VNREIDVFMLQDDPARAATTCREADIFTSALLSGLNFEGREIFAD